MSVPEQSAAPAGEDRIVPPIFVDPESPLMFESVEDAEELLEPEHLDPGEKGYDSEGRLLSILVVQGPGAPDRGEEDGGRDAGDVPLRVQVAAAEAEPTHLDDLRRALVAWLGESRGQRVNLSRAPLEELIRRARRRTRAGMLGPSGLTSKVTFLGVLVGLCVYPSMAIAIRWLHCLGHEPLPDLHARTRLAAMLMYVPMALAALAVGHLVRYAVAWVIPMTRRSIQWDTHHAQGGRRVSLRRLLSVYAIVLAASLLVATAGALLPL